MWHWFFLLDVHKCFAMAGTATNSYNQMCATSATIDGSISAAKTLAAAGTTISCTKSGTSGATGGILLARGGSAMSIVLAGLIGLLRVARQSSRMVRRAESSSFKTQPPRSPTTAFFRRCTCTQYTTALEKFGHVCHVTHVSLLSHPLLVGEHRRTSSALPQVCPACFVIRLNENDDTLVAPAHFKLLQACEAHAAMQCVRA
jgi:hypothetical protein